MTGMTDTERPGLNVYSNPLDDGTYAITLDVGPDRSWTLSDEAALIYAWAVVTHAAMADYDAAVARQLHDLGVPVEHVAMFIKDLRSTRPAGELAEATAPLAFRTGITAELTPFVTLLLDGEPIGQLNPDQTRQHGAAVFELTAVSRLDAAYRRLLVQGLDLDDRAARSAVNGLADYQNPNL